MVSLINVSKSSDLLLHSLDFCENVEKCVQNQPSPDFSSAGRAGDGASFKFIEDLRASVDHEVSVCSCSGVRGSQSQGCLHGQSHSPSTFPAPGLAPEHCPPSPALLPPPFWTAPPNLAALQLPFWSSSLRRLFTGGWRLPASGQALTPPHPFLPAPPRAPRPAHMGQVSTLGVNTSRMGGWAWQGVDLSPAAWLCL